MPTYMLELQDCSSANAKQVNQVLSQIPDRGVYRTARHQLIVRVELEPPLLPTLLDALAKTGAKAVPMNELPAIEVGPSI